MAKSKMDRESWQKVLVALKLTLQAVSEKKLTNWERKVRDVLARWQLMMEVEDLEEIRPIMKVMIGHDPLEGDTHLKGEKQPGLARSATQEPPSMQDLKQRIYEAAKADKTKRFWGLYVHVCKLETLREAYRQAKENNGAPGIDGVTFEAIEESGVEAFLEGIRDQLVRRTYKPQRTRKVEIPKSDGKKTRTLSIPAISDRVVQGALKLILEPIFEADFQTGSFGYRPERNAHEAVERAARAIAEAKTCVIDLDLRAFFDNVRHHILLEKVAERVKDDEIMHLLKLILKSSGKKGVPQGGVISPLLSNIYLDEVDRMLEKAKAVTSHGKYTEMEYARFADDLVILINPHPKNGDLRRKIEKRLREELSKLQVEVNEEKSKVVDLKKGEGFGFLGFQFHRRLSRKGNWCPVYSPKLKKRKELLDKLRKILKQCQSFQITEVIQQVNSVLRGWVEYFRYGRSSKCFSYVRQWVEKKIRRWLMRVRKRRGFGWKRWSSRWLYERIGLFNDYTIRWYRKMAKA